MNSIPENSEISLTPEGQSGLRHSLANPEIGSVDFFVATNGGPKQRLIVYPTGEPDACRIRDDLESFRLVLGQSLSTDSDVRQVYNIPRSSRPLAYEAGSWAMGIFTYTDKELFTDLGRLLAGVARISPLKYVINGDIGMALSIVDFTRPGEQKLFLVPGIEKLLQPIGEEGDPIEYYSHELDRLFSNRFKRASSDFRAGYLDELARPIDTGE